MLSDFIDWPKCMSDNNEVCLLNLQPTVPQHIVTNNVGGCGIN